MKRSELFLTTILIPVDVVMLFLAGISAYALRFSEAVAAVLPVVEQIDFRQHLEITLIAVPLWIMVYALSGMYTVANIRAVAQEFFRVVLSSSTAVMLFIVVIFFQRELISSRFIILAAWGLAIVFVFFGRLVIRLINKLLLQRGIGVHKVLVFGAGRTTEIILKFLRDNPLTGYRAVGHFSSFTTGQRSAVEQIMEREDVDDLILADPSMQQSERMALLDFAHEENRTFRYAADLFETKVSNVDISTIGNIPFLEVKRTPLDGWGKILKRAVDIAGSLLGLILLSPLLALVAILVKVTSSGDVFYASMRVGRRGKKFHTYKFRSMVQNAHGLKPSLMTQNERNDGPLFKMTNDPRITPVGRFLRKSSLDELPQLWNVLKGDMSLIGPRPHEPEEVAQYQKHHKQVLFIRPGLSGLAQVSGRDDLKFEDEIRLDTYYIEDWSLVLDLQILIKTFWVVITRYADTK